jgi:hypothetical protein
MYSFERVFLRKQLRTGLLNSSGLRVVVIIRKALAPPEYHYYPLSPQRQEQTSDAWLGLSARMAIHHPGCKVMAPFRCCTSEDNTACPRGFITPRLRIFVIWTKYHILLKKTSLVSRGKY